MSECFVGLSREIRCMEGDNAHGSIKLNTHEGRVKSLDYGGDVTGLLVSASLRVHIMRVIRPCFVWHPFWDVCIILMGKGAGVCAPTSHPLLGRTRQGQQQVVPVV